MKIEVHEVGQEGSRIVMIDDFMENADQAIDLAASLAPFPQVANHYYPGLRRKVAGNEPAFTYFDRICRALPQILSEVWGVHRFQITEAGFSLVTQRPNEIQLIQRIPHFDTLDLGNFAVLHYLSRPEKGGTSFYRHRRTGFEVITADRHPRFRTALDEDLRAYGPPAEAYIGESTQAFERIAEYEGRFNRLLVYQGSLLHSGQIPEGFDFSTDPRTGRLTGNVFLSAR